MPPTPLKIGWLHPSTAAYAGCIRLAPAPVGVVGGCQSPARGGGGVVGRAKWAAGAIQPKGDAPHPTGRARRLADTLSKYPNWPKWATLLEKYLHPSRPW
jgi:hypothetical protein